ncbi:unnamed protein product [Darwinula stevensoni]|uniref:Peptidase M13 C-terminal domain-containing protein n=1 Tax=Darwinula stevensoni TaxID=69355 RepID=A0A7R8XKP6_9CRUS|nr:unnamed protein product [Darwinula stevensoni]CAG0895468.1 unnamed protein product [Darwinula stevensoni]
MRRWFAAERHQHPRREHCRQWRDQGGVSRLLGVEREIRRRTTAPWLTGNPNPLHLNPRQLFWISAANVWCTKYRNEALKYRILTGKHSPAEFRVRGPFQNTPEFAQDFKCALGTPYNPETRCKVW